MNKIKNIYFLLKLYTFISIFLLREKIVETQRKRDIIYIFF
jgi:hypothetical protein